MKSICTLRLVLTSTVRTCHPARELPLKIEGAGGEFLDGVEGKFFPRGFGQRPRSCRLTELGILGGLPNGYYSQRAFL